MTTAFKQRMNTLSVRLADRVDLAIEFATLGGYGLEPITGSGDIACGPAKSADAGCGQRDREVAWEVSTPARRDCCDRPVRLIDAYTGAFCSAR